MAFYDKDAPTEVVTDTSPVGLGAILVQEQQGVQRAVAFASRSLRAVVSNFRESGDRSENSNFFLFAPKDPFGELFSKIIFKSSSEFFFRQKLGKFEIGLNVPDGSIEIMQISTFLKLSFKTTQRFLELTLSQSFLHPFCLLPNYILSRPEHSFIRS